MKITSDPNYRSCIRLSMGSFLLVENFYPGEKLLSRSWWLTFFPKMLVRLYYLNIQTNWLLVSFLQAEWQTTSWKIYTIIRLRKPWFFFLHRKHWRPNVTKRGKNFDESHFSKSNFFLTSDLTSFIMVWIGFLVFVEQISFKVFLLCFLQQYPDKPRIIEGFLNLLFQIFKLVLLHG